MWNRIITGLIGLALLLSACDALNPTGPTPTPTRDFSAPTLAASPTVEIRSSDDLYGDSISGQNNATAAAAPARGGLPPINSGTREPDGSALVEIALSDGTLLIADQYSGAFGRVPGVLLLARDRLAWETLPVQLQAAGYSALSVEIEGTTRAQDIDALLQALMGLSNVDPARIAVMGMGSGADMALMGCALTELCDAAVLLSPQSQNTLANVIATYNPRPLLLAAATSDPVAHPTALALSGLADAGTLATFDSGQGLGLLRANPALADTVVDWLAGVFE